MEGVPLLFRMERTRRGFCCVVPPFTPPWYGYSLALTQNILLTCRRKWNLSSIPCVNILKKQDAEDKTGSL